MGRTAQRVQRPAGADPSRGGARNPREILAGRGRHHRNRLVQRQRRVAGRLPARSPCLRDVAGRGRGGPRGGRRLHGAQPAETPLRRRIDGPHEPHGLDVGRRREPRGPRGDLPPAGRRLHGAGPRPDGRRRGHPARRDGLRHAQRQGRALRHRPALRGARAADSRHGLGNAGRRQRPHPLGADRRGLRRVGLPRTAAVGRSELRLRRPAADALPRTAGRRGRNPHLGPPERRTAQRHGRLRRNPRNVRRGCRRVHAPRAGEHRRRMLRNHPGPYFRTGEDRRPLHAAPAARAAPRHHVERPGTAAGGPRGQLHQHRRAHERRRVGEVRPVDPRRQLRGGTLGGPRAGRGRGADRRRLHGRRTDRRRRGHAHVPQPDGLGTRNRPRAGDDRLLEVGGASSGARSRAGQVGGQLHLAERGRSGVPAPGGGDPPLRSRRRGDALRRTRPGRHLRAQGRSRRTRLQAPDRQRIPGRGYRLRPQCAGRRHGNPRTRRIRQSLHRRHALDPGAPAPCEGLGRRLEPLVRLPRQQRRARGHALGVPLPRDPRRHGHGDRQPPDAARVQRDRTRTARTGRGRDPLPSGGCRRTPHGVCPRGAADRPGPAAGPRCLAQRAARRAHRIRHAQRHRRPHRGGRPRRLPHARQPDGGDRPPADARHGARRRIVRRGYCSARGRCSCRRS